MKKLVCSFVLAVALAQACPKSDAGPVLQVALDVECGVKYVVYAVDAVVIYTAYEVHKAGKLLKRVAKSIVTGLG